MKKKAVVLFNLGGPNKLEDVRGFLFNLFYDKAIIPFPKPLRWIFANAVSFYRKKFSQEIYKAIGGGSPLLELTLKQAERLERSLKEDKENKYKVFVSMRYWHPFSEETIKKIEEYNPEEILLVPLYPQFSTTTTGSSLEDFYNNASKSALSSKQTKAICCFYSNKKFIKAHSALIKKEIKRAGFERDKSIILFSAHGLPISVIEKGDPYEKQVKETVRLIMEEVGVTKVRHKLCYQSKVGPKEWLSPSTESEISKAGERGDSVIIVPVAFVSEHSETLVELDKEYKEIAVKSGVRRYSRVAALGTNEIFIDSLKDLCLKLSCLRPKSLREVISSDIKKRCSSDCVCVNNN